MHSLFHLLNTLIYSLCARIDRFGQYPLLIRCHATAKQSYNKR